MWNYKSEIKLSLVFAFAGNPYGRLFKTFLKTCVKPPNPITSKAIVIKSNDKNVAVKQVFGFNSADCRSTCLHSIIFPSSYAIPVNLEWKRFRIHFVNGYQHFSGLDKISAIPLKISVPNLYSFTLVPFNSFMTVVP